MDRLTKLYKSGCYGLVKVKDDEQEVDSPYPNTLRAILESFKQLGEYEDTNLTPEQVAALQADRDAWKRRAEAAEKYFPQACYTCKNENKTGCPGIDCRLHGWYGYRSIIERDEGKEG
jgi:hypothetical protein